jgi:hypothetical protein
MTSASHGGIHELNVTIREANRDHAFGRSNTFGWELGWRFILGIKHSLGKAGQEKFSLCLI